MSAPRPVVLALDQGGHASRACLFDATRTALAAAEAPIGTRHGPQGEVEHDAAELLASLGSAAGAALAQLGARGERCRIEAAGLAVQRSTVVCFDRLDGAALSPAISWQDRRNAAWVESFAPQAARVRALTGLPLSPHYGVGKLRWCLEHLPAVQAARAVGRLQLAPLASYLAARLTARPARTDPANASRTLLWDSARHDWSPELLALFGIERSLLPDCAPTSADYGTLSGVVPTPAAGCPGTAAADAQLATLGAVPLTALTGDQSAIPFAFGAPDPGALYINLGTGAFLQRPLARRPDDAAPLLASVLALLPPAAWYCVEGTVNGAGSALGALVEQRGLDQAALWRQLERASPAAAALPLYVNGIGGLGSPYWRATQRSYFVGAGDALDCFAAVLESVVFLIATNFDALCRWGGRPQRVLVSGGLSRSDWLCRHLAACLDVPVLRSAHEATLLGVAALAAPALFASAPAPAALARFEPGQLAPAQRRALAARRARFDELLARDAGQPR